LHRLGLIISFYFGKLTLNTSCVLRMDRTCFIVSMSLEASEVNWKSRLLSTRLNWKSGLSPRDRWTHINGHYAFPPSVEDTSSSRPAKLDWFAPWLLESAKKPFALHSAHITFTFPPLGL
jgi:hypothetical protein